MAKYDALRQHLEDRSGSVSLSFEDISGLVPGGLPPSAFNLEAWWGNEAIGTHVQARAWLDAGYRVTVDRSARTARFEPLD